LTGQQPHPITLNDTDETKTQVCCHKYNKNLKNVM